jgi:hypothetical protein
MAKTTTEKRTTADLDISLKGLRALGECVSALGYKAESTQIEAETLWALGNDIADKAAMASEILAETNKLK